jgi:alkylation response protein AidB-like acyl-CoA dehydrogenase
MENQDAAHSRELAEQSRERDWKGKSFLRELFLGRLRPELLVADQDVVHPEPRPEFARFLAELEQFLRLEVDPVAIDETGEYPPLVIERLARMGTFGLKIDTKYGGLGFSHREYVKVMQLIGSYDGNLTALLSAHQSIGVPHPVELFGSEELKQKYLPRCARGAISAFALTEPAVGSDPARLGTIARPSADGTHFVIDGQKLWCTNGTLAEVIVVLARNPETKRISCFVVEMNTPGVKVERRCHFMGLKALANGLISFDSVRVPRENLVGEEGDGLKIALVTLNTGRLTLPAATAGAAKVALEICRKWATARVQWGQPVGKHEAIAQQLADMAATTYAMEAFAENVGLLADRNDRDLRLEVAAAKEWNTTRGWELTDVALQIRGGRGYETERSLAARGEPSIGIERMLRDSRINRIFEGSSEIMHLFIAREAVDKHLELAGVLIDPKQSLGNKLKALPGIAWFYMRWYPSLWIAFGPGLGRFGRLAAPLRYARRAARRLARSIFHGMLRHGPGLEKKQAFLFRAVDVALELTALTACVLRAHAERTQHPNAIQIALRAAELGRQRAEIALRAMWHNDDTVKYRFAQDVLAERFTWLERGVMRLPYEVDELRPRSMDEYFKARATAGDGRATAGDQHDDARARRSLAS